MLLSLSNGKQKGDQAIHNCVPSLLAMNFNIFPCASYAYVCQDVSGAETNASCRTANTELLILSNLCDKSNLQMQISISHLMSSMHVDTKSFELKRRRRHCTLLSAAHNELVRNRHSQNIAPRDGNSPLPQQREGPRLVRSLRPSDRRCIPPLRRDGSHIGVRCYTEQRKPPSTLKNSELDSSFFVP